MAKSRRRVGVDPFTEDAEELELVDLDDEEMESRIMAKETAKKKARKAAEAEAVEDDDDEDEEEVDDEAEVEDDDEDEEDDDEDEEDDEEGEDDEDPEDEEDESDPDAFIPWILHDEAEWELQEALDNVGKGDPVIIYDAKNNNWFKLQPIKVGEVPATEVEPTA
jgi:hypothetical protein